ncbi:MAG TPA: cadherin-like domain-containing protein [Leptolyngbyaceae cyanobacterium M33_DOE_097]|uniref:Tandem-95 repeat protein n=1 Tax=Oscillatoriales cyanobacterium SpSt-418 TaxID=2282169 RepID=A0A7C3KAS9_9CYAN|nr:cadherin-like domain-containing protein [Leptolyngbyaceae cyanobacterium M33_DOE_097]
MAIPIVSVTANPNPAESSNNTADSNLPVPAPAIGLEPNTAPTFRTPGRLDPTFGTNGIVTTGFVFGGAYGSSVVLQPDGKFVVVGQRYSYNPLYDDFGLVRYNSDGSLDTSFRTDGKVTTDFGNSDFGYSVTMQPDGKLVVAGWVYNATTSNRDFGLSRHNPDGSLDATFGAGGRVTTDFGQDDEAYSVALQPDGKLVVVGRTYNPSTFNWDFGLSRYNADGSLDTTFGMGGRVTTDFGHSDEAFSVALQPDGKLVVVGRTYNPSIDNWDFELTRYNWDGSLDTTFGMGGRVTTDFGQGAGFWQGDEAFSVVLQPDGKLVVAGRIYNLSTSNWDVGLTRYNPDGSLDTTFGMGGRVTTDFGQDDEAFSVVLQPDGKLVAVGRTYNFSTYSSDFGLSRYNPDGSLDMTFGIGGKVTIHFGEDEGRSVAVQPDGKLVVAGSIYSNFALLRYVDNQLPLITININEDPGAPSGAVGTLVSSLASLGVTVSDPDVGAVAGIAVTAADTTNGKWFYSIDDGSSWNPLGAVSTSSARLLAADDKTRIYFQPNENLNGTLADISTFRAWDQTTGSNGELADVTNNGGTTAFSNTVNTFTIAVTPVIDPPILNHVELSVTEGGSVALSTDDFDITDPDNNISTYSVQNVRGGNFQILSNVSWVSTAFFTKDDIANGNVRFVHSGNELAPSFQIQANSNMLGIMSNIIDGTVNFTSVNDAPIFNSVGNLDPSFGINGIVTTDFGSDETASRTVLQPDGKLVVAGTINGDFGLSRYNSDGSLDLNFGTGGVVTTDFGGFDRGSNIVLQPDGKVIVIGRVDNPDGYSWDFGLSRYNLDGSLDTTFGTGGKVITDFRRNDTGSSAVLQSDGKLVLAGWSTERFTMCCYTSYSVLSRYNSDGSLDTSFGVNGQVLADGAKNIVTVQPDGKLIVAYNSGSGFAYEPPPPSDFWLRRYNADGSIDTSFGLGGIVTTDFSGDDSASDITLQLDGKLVVVGSLYNSNTGNSDLWLRRYNAEGSLDTTFGVGGLVTTDFGEDESAADVVVQPDGKIVVAGSVNDESRLIRYNADGSLDTTFGLGGAIATVVTSVILQPDGNLVVVGSSYNPVTINHDFVVARHLGNPLQPLTVVIQEDAGAPIASVGMAVSALVSLSRNVIDPDAGALTGMAITAADTTNGTWFYSTDNGSNWNLLGSVSTSNARLLAADANTRLYFQPNANFNGTLTNAITFHAWDQTTGNSGELADVTSNGGTTAFSNTTNTFNLNVTSGENEATGKLSVTGAPAEGSILTAALMAVVDFDGSTTTAYQWQENVNGTWINIAGADTDTLNIPADQSYVGKSLRVVATTTDAMGGTTDFVSAAYAIANIDDEATGSLSVTGAAAEGGVLTAALTNVVDLDGSPTTAYQWQQDINGTWMNLVGANAASLSIPADQSYVGKSVRVVATTTDAMGGTTDFVSAAYAIANINDAPVAGDDASILDPYVPLVLPISTLLSNDIDAEADALSVTAINDAVGGTASLANGNVIFTLDPNTFDGNAGFNYTVSDGQGGTDIGAVALSLNRVLMLGTVGSDTLKVSKVDEVVFARGGDDTIKIKENRSVNDYLFAGDGIDTIKVMGNWVRFANFNARTSSIEIIDARGKDIRGTSTDNVFDFSTAQLLKVRQVKLKEGNDIVTTSTVHQKRVTTYDGQGGVDTINLVFTPEQLSHFSATTIAEIANYLASPTGKRFNSSNALGLGFKAKNFESATANVLLDGQLYDISDHLDSIKRVISMTTAYYTESVDENSLILGTATADTINGSKLQNILFGGGGDDNITGGAGSDWVFGCSGSDTFIFNNVSDGVDAIADFDITADTIQISGTGFTDVGTTGLLAEERFVVAGSAGTTAQRFIYNNLTGGLFYDSNGSLDGGMTQIAQMSAGLALTHNHFRVGF